MTNLLHFPLVFSSFFLGLGMSDCPAAPASDQTERFGIALLGKLMAAGTDRNVVISPFSLELALGMVYAGCSGTGADELSRVVGFAPQNDSQPALFPGMALSSGLPPEITLKVANSLWCDRSTTLQPAFQEKAKKLFGADVQSADLGTANTMKAINDWVAKATEDRITDLLRQPPKPPLVLIDAVYFKGAWESPFPGSQNSKAQFHRDNGGACEVNMMKRGLSAPYLATDHFQAIKLPYKGGALEMLLILPANGVSVANVVHELSAGSWKSTIDQFTSGQGTIALPRFKVTYRDSVVSPLADLGLKAIFKPSRDFATMFADPREFYVSEIIQQTYLRVDENGSEAAAATEVQMEATAIRRPTLKPFNLVFDRPFLFAIIDDQSGQIVFIGVLRDPEQAKL